MLSFNQWSQLRKKQNLDCLYKINKKCNALIYDMDCKICFEEDVFKENKKYYKKGAYKKKWKILG